MANFVLLHSGGKMPESPAEQAAVMKEWETWYGGLGKDVVDAGNPFTPMAKSIASDGKVSDGSVGAPASGYSIIKADSLNAAVTLAQRCPILKGDGKITVYETFNMM